MGKGKPRHDPNKRQNRMGGWCSHCEDINGKLWCPYGGRRATDICGGNPHMCKKVTLRRYARLIECQKIDGSLPRWLKNYIDIREYREG